MELAVIFTDKYKVAGVKKGDSCPAFDTLTNFDSNYQKTVDSLFSILEKVSKDGLQNTPSKLFHLADANEKIYEFIKGDIRLFWFKGEGDLVVICTSAMIKKKQEVDAREVRRAVTMKQQYFESIKNKTLSIEDMTNGFK